MFVTYIIIYGPSVIHPKKSNTSNTNVYFPTSKFLGNESRKYVAPVPPKMQWKHVYRLKAHNKQHLLMRAQTVREATLFTWLLITEPFDPEHRACASFTLRAGALEPSTVLTLT